MSLSLDIRRNRLLVIRDAIDAGGGGFLHILDGAEPDDTPPLLIISLPEPCFELHATDASMTLSVEGNVAVGGIPTRARFLDGSGTVCWALSAGLPGSGATLIISDGQPTPGSTMYVGGVVTVSGTVLEP